MTDDSREREAFEQECADVDAILGELGIDPDRVRTEGGRLILSRIFDAIRAGHAARGDEARDAEKLLELLKFALPIIESDYATAMAGWIVRARAAIAAMTKREGKP